MSKNYRQFTPRFWKGVCEYNKLEVDFEQDFALIKNEIKKKAKRQLVDTSFTVTRQYNSKKIVLYFKILSKEINEIKLQVTAIYVNMERIYIGYYIEVFIYEED